MRVCIYREREMCGSRKFLKDWDKLDLDIYFVFFIEVSQNGKTRVLGAQKVVLCVVGGIINNQIVENSGGFEKVFALN